MNDNKTVQYKYTVEGSLAQYVSDYLDREMKRRHLSKEKVAANAGVSSRTVQRWRNSPVTQFESLERILRGLQVSPQELFRDFGREPAAHSFCARRVPVLLYLRVSARKMQQNFAMIFVQM